MTSTIEKLIGLVETIVTTIIEIRTSQINIEKQQKEVIKVSQETNKINKEILEQLNEINAKMDIVEEETEESSNEEESSTEEKVTSQEQMNAFFNAFMNTMQSQDNASEEVGSSQERTDAYFNTFMNTMQAQPEATPNETPYNEYPGYNDTSKPDDIEAIADRIRKNAAAQEKLNGNKFSSLDNFDYDNTFGGSSFNQNNEKPPEQPVYHRVEAQPKQMNLDGVFNNNNNNNNSTPTGNNWYGNTSSTQQKEYKLGLSPDRQSMIFRRSYNGEDIVLPPFHKGSIAWNTVENKLRAENRKLSSLTNKDLSDLSEWMNELTNKGINIFSPTNQNMTQVNNNDDVFDTYQQPQVNNNPYNQPTQDISRRNMTSYNNSMVYNNSMSGGYTQPTNNMWAHYGEDIINNSSTINQAQPNFTNGGYTNPYNVKPVFNCNSFNIYGG